MQQSFSAAAQLFPVYKDIPLAQLIKEESEPALAEVGKAIEREKLRRCLQSIQEFDERMQQLPSACRGGLYRDKRSNTLAFQ
jgi:hypothetical protein